MSDKVYKMKMLKCDDCGVVLELLVDGGGQIKCGDKDLQEIDPQTADSSKEKHVPVVEDATEGTAKVTVGSTKHPMEEAHYIQFISASKGMTIYRKYLKPEDEPEAEFPVSANEIDVAYEHCNVHGFWKTT